MDIQLISPQVETYLEDLVPPRPQEMQAMEARARESGFPIIGPVIGYLCYQIGSMIGARRVFELGSGYGYSTAWFAKAVAENGGGEVHHAVWDRKLSQQARSHLDALGYADILHYHVGEAVSTLREMPGQFDLVFNDIDKAAYPESLAVISAKLRPGGVLIVDNMFWYGRIFDLDDRSPSTEGVRELTRLLQDDPGWITMVLPLRDGLLVAYKI